LGKGYYERYYQLLQKNRRMPTECLKKDSTRWDTLCLVRCLELNLGPLVG
jgi:hypothetical protein